MAGDPATNPRPLAWITRIAVAVLVADALVLGAVGFSAGRPLFVVVAGFSLVAAWVVRRLERGYRRQLAEINAARRELGSEVRAMAGEVARRRPEGGTSAETP